MNKKLLFKQYLSNILELSFIALLVGIVGGIVGGAFHKAVDIATEFRCENTNLIYWLPLGGLLIVFIYRIFKLKTDPGTNRILSSVRGEEQIPISIGPSIFFATIITHLFGGSAGREGAALQLGGAIGSGIGKAFKLDKKIMPLVILCGMSAVFSALFGTPLTAVIFSIEVCCVGMIFESAFIPCFISSYIALYISHLFGNPPVRFLIEYIPQTSLTTVIQASITGLACAMVSILFCHVMSSSHKLIHSAIKNDYLRAFAGGVAIILLTLIFRTYDYNGAGMDVINRAVSGNAVSYAFILKIVFTAITIGAGFKGGEIVPTFFIGATFGCVFGPIIGLPASFTAALGICTLFAGVVNCPIASIILAIELFGSNGILLYAAAIFTCHALSGYWGLYSEQKIMFSKHCFETLNMRTK